MRLRDQERDRADRASGPRHSQRPLAPLCRCICATLSATMPSPPRLFAGSSGFCRLPAGARAGSLARGTCAPALMSSRRCVTACEPRRRSLRLAARDTADRAARRGRWQRLRQPRALMARQWRAWWPTGLRVCLALAAAGRVIGSAAALPAACGPVLVADAGNAGGLPREIMPPGVKLPRFVPSYEWQRVLPGQAVPPGLWIKMDVRTGDTYAKFLGVRHVSGRAASVCIGVCVWGGGGGGKAVTDLTGDVLRGHCPRRTRSAGSLRTLGGRGGG